MKRTVRLLLSVALLALGTAWLGGQERPQLELVRTLDTGEDLAVVAAWSPDGRLLAYGTETEVSRREITVKSDREAYTYPSEVWVTDFTKKPKRILKRKQFRDRQGKIPSFSVTRLLWSPDGQKLAVELTDDDGESATFLLTPKGKRFKLGEGRRNFLIGYGAGWLGDSESLGLLSEALHPRLLHQVGLVRVNAGRELSLFGEKTFAAVAWLPRAQKVVLMERDREFAEPPQLVLGDLQNGQIEVLDELSEGYLGGLQTTGDEARVSYFVGQERLAVRSVVAASSVEYWPIPLGRYEWSVNSDTLLFIEPQEVGQRTGWRTLHDPANERKVRLLEELPVFEFAQAPDGQRLAVLTAGKKPELRIYRLTLPPSR
jgi:dipeptidyl aminopeptidase/acylaminoacyl peptidase